MSAPLIRIWIVFLAVLIQIGTWTARTETLRVSVGSTQAPESHAPESSETDATEEVAERLALVDDASEATPERPSAPDLSRTEAREWRHSWRHGLAPQGPMPSALFKPPRG